MDKFIKRQNKEARLARRRNERRLARAGLTMKGLTDGKNKNI